MTKMQELNSEMKQERQTGLKQEWLKVVIRDQGNRVN